MSDREHRVFHWAVIFATPWLLLAINPNLFITPYTNKWIDPWLYTGFFLAFWATPHMSLGHLLLAVGMSAYMLIAIVHEERDLVALFGADYEQYCARVGKLTPRFKRQPAPPI